MKHCLLQISQLSVMPKRISISGSMIGSIAETQEVVDFCQAMAIFPETEEIGSEKLDHVFGLLRQKNDSAKRYVLNVSKSVLLP